MLVRFTTESYGHVDYLESVAASLLKMLGTSGKIPSALAADRVQHHLEALQQAVTFAVSEESEESGDDDDYVSIKTRAKPLIDMLENAVENGDYLMWDYA